MFTITKQSSFQNSEIHSIMYIRAYGSFTLEKFVSKNVSDSDMKQYLPWPPWVTRQEIETILSVLRHTRRPMQVNSDCCCQRHYRITWGRVFNFRSGCMHTMHLLSSVSIQPNLELKTRPKQLLGSLPLVIALPDLTQVLTCQLKVAHASRKYRLF
jgi:hypothetical protein